MSFIMMDMLKFVIVVFSIVYVVRLFANRNDEKPDSRQPLWIEEQKKEWERQRSVKQRQVVQQSQSHVNQTSNCCPPRHSGTGFVTIVCALVVGAILGG